MTVKLFVQAIGKFLLGIVLVGALIFWPAGTCSFFNGWLFMGILFIPMFLAGIVMMLKNPGLLKSRLNAKEKQQDQSFVVKLSGLMFWAGFIVAGLCLCINLYRHHMRYRRIIHHIPVHLFLFIKALVVLI